MNNIGSAFLASKVARRLFALFLLCSLVPLVMLAVFTYFQVSTQLVDQAHRELQTECRSVGMATVEYLQFLESDLKIAQQSLEADWNSSFSLSLEDLPDGFDFRFSGLHLIEMENGREVFRLAEPRAMASLDGDQVEHLLNGKTLVVFQPAPNQAADVMMVRMLLDGATLVVGSVESGLLWESLMTDWDHFAADEFGVSLYSSLESGLPKLELQRSLSLNAVSGQFEWEIEGEVQSAAYREFFLEPSFGLRLTILCSRPNSDIMEPLVSFGRRFLFVGLLTILVVLLVSIAQIRRSLVPIQQLHAATLRLAENDFETRVEVESGDEFEDLADSFNSMSEKLQRRTHELELASRAKMEFLANMSHELRTPMTAILGFADVCMDSETDEQERVRCLGIVRENSEHLLKVINDILDVSKIEAGRLTVETTRSETASVCTNVVNMLEHSVRGKDIELSIDIHPGVPKHIQTDAIRLQQVLLNLCGNAIKFTSKGQVCLRVRAQEREGMRDLLAFEVSDTGVGIAEDKIESIFDAFVQADTSTTRIFGGTGLGLPISRSLAKLLGGDLACQSQLGKGSVFTLLIDPGAQEDELPALQLSKSQVPGNAENDGEDWTRPLHGRVLVADDVAINRRLAAIILKRAGLEVEFAKDGLEAVEKAKAAAADGEAFAIILMDMQMPNLDGYAATEQLRRDGYEAPIIAFTSHSMVEERTRCADVGCDGFASKPIDRQALLTLIRNLTQQGVADAT